MLRKCSRYETIASPGLQPAFVGTSLTIYVWWGTQGCELLAEIVSQSSPSSWSQVRGPASCANTPPAFPTTLLFFHLKAYRIDTRHSYACMKVLPPSLIEWLRLVRRHRVVVVLQSMEVGQLGRIGKTVTLHAATAGWFESVTATILRRHTTVKIVEKITVNIERAPSCAVVGLQNFCYIAKLTTYVFSGAECFSK